MTLYELKKSGTNHVAALLTTVTREYDRISMHGVRRSLLRSQAESLGIPLEEVWIPKDATNKVYEAQMRAVLTKYLSRGIRKVAFGDLFLEDIRAYRESRLAELGMSGLFPIWGRDTKRLAREFVELGFKAILCCVDPKKLSMDFCGREFDRPFLHSLPEGVDPCGENGEFHTYVYAGPIFRRQIKVRKGEVVLKDGFYFADIIPKG